MIKKIIKFFLNLPLPFFAPYKWIYTFFLTNKKKKSNKKILFALKNLGLGDCILMRPSILFLMKEVKAEFYFYHENKIAKDWWLFFFQAKVKSLTEWQEVKKIFFFEIYDLSLNENPFVFPLRRLNCKKLIGIGFGYKKFLYDFFRTPLKKIHAADYWFYLIHGEQKDFLKKDFYLEKKIKNQKSKIIMVPFAGVKNGKVVSSEKCWSIENYLQLAKKIYHQTKIKVTFIGTPAERELFEKKSKEIKSNFLTIDNQIGQLDLEGVYHLLSQAKLVICNNSGIYHFSVAMKVPTISFSNGVDIEMWKNFMDDEIHKIFSFEEEKKIEKEVKEILEF